ncbi:MAG: hypothetical protein GXO29_01585 [Thermotogae bacterium]|nr:hypothetical protein [Thermotogota bacterium]
MLGIILISSSTFEPLKGVDNVKKVERPADVRLLLGGPDGYGYTYLSTQDGDSVPFNFIDISTTGTAMGAGDDWCSGSSVNTLYYLGFSFNFYGETYDSVSICSNGAIVFDTPYVYFGLSNAALPTTLYSGPRAFVAAMWDDLNPSDAAADDIYFQSFTSCPDGYPGACAVIQYHNVPRYGGSVLMNFEIVLYDSGHVKLMYNSALEYNDATIGIQGKGADTVNNYFLEYVYAGNPSTHIPDSGTAILFLYPVSTEIAEAPAEMGGLKVVGRTVIADEGSIYDATGRFVARFKERYYLPSSGIFFIVTDKGTYRVIVR